MEIDEIEEISSHSSDHTPKRPSTPEIKTLSKDEQIALRAREHVSTWKQYLAIANEGPTAGLRALLTTAQESQKALQKLMENHEIEALVKGWNPWEVKQTLFPPQAKQEREGKPKSSLYKRMKYDNQDTWPEVADIALAVCSLYKATKQG